MNLPVVYTNNQIACLIEGSPVSAWLDEQGQPMWFASTELGKAIGLSQPRMSNLLKELSSDDKGIRETNTLGGRQSITVISRSGAYQVIAQLQDRDLGRRLRKGLSDLAVAYETGRLTANYASLQSQIDEIRALVSSTANDVAKQVFSKLMDRLTGNQPAKMPQPYTDIRVELTRKFFEECTESAPGNKLMNDELFPALVHYLHKHRAILYAVHERARLAEIGSLLKRSGVPRKIVNGYRYSQGIKIKTEWMVQ